MKSFVVLGLLLSFSASAATLSRVQCQYDHSATYQEAVKNYGQDVSKSSESKLPEYFSFNRVTNDQDIFELDSDKSLYFMNQNGGIEFKAGARAYFISTKGTLLTVKKINQRGGSIPYFQVYNCSVLN